MLAKRNRLTKKEFDTVFSAGSSVSGKVGYIMYVRDQSQETAKISCVVSGNEAKTSIKRTRIRRRGYAVVEDMLDNIPSDYSIIWFLPGQAESMQMSKLRESFSDILRKSSITDN
jgi:ribonuclease P protein component